MLATYAIELHTKTDSSYITARTTDGEIKHMDPIWAYFEYYVIYMLGKCDSDVALVLFLELEDIRNELKSARDQLAMQKTIKKHNDTKHEDENEVNDVEMEYVENVDIKLFHGNAEQDESGNERESKNLMYLETIHYHKNNNVTELEIDKDISTIIGILYFF